MFPKNRESAPQSLLLPATSKPPVCPGGRDRTACKGRAQDFDVGHPAAGDECLEEVHVHVALKRPELERSPAMVGAVLAPAGSADAATLPQAPLAACRHPLPVVFCFDWVLFGISASDLYGVESNVTPVRD